jgi:hypothetical protein
MNTKLKMVYHMKKMVGNIYQLRGNQKSADTHMVICVPKNLRKYKKQWHFL